MARSGSGQLRVRRSPSAAIGAASVPSRRARRRQARSWLPAGDAAVNSACLPMRAAAEGDAGEPTRADVQRARQRAGGARRCWSPCTSCRWVCPEDWEHLADAGARLHPGALLRLRRSAAGRRDRVGRRRSSPTRSCTATGAPRPQLGVARRLRRCGSESRRTRCAFCCSSPSAPIAGAATFLVFNPRPDGADDRCVGRHLGSDGRDDALPVHGDRRGGLAALREDPRARAADAARTGADRPARARSSRGAFSSPTCLPCSGSAASAQSGIAWEAHIGGYFAGLLTFGFFDASRNGTFTEQPISTEFLRHMP